MSSSLVILLTFALFGVVYGRRGLRTTNTERAYGRWNRTGIPYCIDPAFTSTHKQMIQAAISIITADLNYCVVWTPVPCSDPKYKIRFTSLQGGPGSPPQLYCWSYPGVNLNLAATTSEQMISLATGPQGCLDGTMHSILKYLAIAMGKRNEHQRGDRNSSITMQESNLAVPAAYDLYGAEKAYWKLFAYDYCSITHNQPSDFANPGTVAFTVPSTATPNFIPKLDYISNTDCQLLSMMYGCDKTACTQPECSVQAASSSAVTAMATNMMSSGTTMMSNPMMSTTMSSSNLPCCPPGTGPTPPPTPPPTSPAMGTTPAVTTTGTTVAGTTVAGTTIAGTTVTGTTVTGTTVTGTTVTGTTASPTATPTAIPTATPTAAATAATAATPAAGMTTSVMGGATTSSTCVPCKFCP